MRKNSWVGLGILCCLAVPATGHADSIETLEFGLHAGYRVDEIDWNIASDLTGTLTPNIISELTWEDLEIFELGGSGKMAIGNDVVDFLTYIRGTFNYGWILDGANRDSDYVGDNRTLEFSRSVAVTEDDHVLDASIGLGFQWKFWQNRLAVAPLGGYSYHEQNLRDSNGMQTVSEPSLVLPRYAPPGVGPFPGLDSTLETEWQGPWAGIDVEVRPHRRVSLFGTFEYHWADYEAEADWNLRSDFAHPVSFTHDADDARGYLVGLGGRYRHSSRFAVEFRFDYQNWQTDPGTIQFFDADGTTSVQRLNEANWKSSAASLGFTYSFF